MTLQSLLKRRSVVAARMSAPGPDAGQIMDLIRAGIRVPDHKALAPWRFLIFTSEARAEFGRALASVYEGKQGDDCKPRGLENERNRFLRAPVVIAVISSPVESEKVPYSEQLLSAGAACQNILHGAQAMGFGAQWITEWVAYDEDVHKILHLRDGETVAGFIYIGTPTESPGERPRVEPENVTTYWKK